GSFFLEELEAVGDQLGPAPAPAGVVGADPVLHLRRELHLGEADDHADHGHEQRHDQELDDQPEPEVGHDVGDQTHRSTSPRTKSSEPMMAMMSGTRTPRSEEHTSE